jgi:hypothetical protein
VPRRFGVNVLLVLMTGFAVLFALLRALNAPPPAFATIGVFFLGVTVSQVVLFQGKRPRMASMLVGAVLLPLVMISAQLLDRSGRSPAWEWLDMLVISTVFGAIWGYLAGTLVAGVFLLLERWTGRAFQVPVEIELQPFTVADVDVLIGWLRSPILFAAWSRGQYAPPLERAHIEPRLAEAARKEPARLCFRAVYRDSRRMVGYVELGDIDRAAKSAAVEFPLVDPQEPERGELSVALLRAVVAMAPGRLGLVHLRADVPWMLRDSLKCYRMAGFLEVPVLCTEQGGLTTQCTWDRTA